MRVLLTTLLAILPSILRSRAALQLENLALRHQIGVLQRSAAKHLKLTSGDRLLWICLSRLWRDWCSALAIVKPETVLAWHRAGFRVVLWCFVGAGIFSLYGPFWALPNEFLSQEWRRGNGVPA